MKFDTLRLTLGSAVANGGTITFGYPAGRNNGFYRGGRGHQLFAMGALFKSPADFTIAFGANIVVTYNGATTIPAETEVALQVNYPGDYSNVDNVTDRDRFSLLSTVLVPFGAVAAAGANTITTTQALLAATSTGAALSGTTAGVLDVPRNVVAAWTNTAVITVRGFDEFGEPLTESSASGTSFAGKKAFKRVTRITVSADVTGLTVGTGKVLGLPFFLPDAGFRLVSLEDGAAATAGAVVAGDNAVATALTGDVRGTWAPNGTPNATVVFAALVAVDDPSARGAAQFAG
jgi:hypothetical protein